MTLYRLPTGGHCGGRGEKPRPAEETGPLDSLALECAAHLVAGLPAISGYLFERSHDCGGQMFRHFGPDPVERRRAL